MRVVCVEGTLSCEGCVWRGHLSCEGCVCGGDIEL